MPQSPEATPRRPLPLRWLIAGGTAALIVAGWGLALRAAHRQKDATLASEPKRVGTLRVLETVYKIQHRYVGTLMAWEEAKIGPQFLSGYLTEVRVRPGDTVRRGQTLAVLEPDRARAQATVSRMQAEAIEAKLSALAKESERIQGLQKKGIVSENEGENKLAEVKSERARLEAAKAQMAGTDVEFQDTVLKAPFDGEVGDRFLDPGAFVRPGTSILEVVNRSRIRCVADAPEGDHPFLAVGTAVHLYLLADARTMEA